MRVVSRQGQCQRWRVDINTCLIHDCRTRWTPEDRQIIVKGRERAEAVWNSTTKRGSDPERIEYEWVPY